MGAGDRRSESDRNDAPLAASATSEAAARRDDTRKEDRGAPAPRADSEPDVLLDVPALEVKEISLDVGELRARVSLHASVASLVALDAGAEVHADHAKLDLEGVDAQAKLKVHLDRVYGIITRALDSIDQNPELLGRSLQPVRDTVQEAPAELEAKQGSAAELTGGAVAQTVQEPARVEEHVEPQPALRRLAARTRKRVGDRIADAARGTWDVRGSAVQAREAIASAARKVAGAVRRKPAPGEQAKKAPPVEQELKGDAASVPEGAVAIEASAHADRLQQVDEASGETLQGKSQTHREGLPPEGAQQGVPYRDVDVGIEVQGAPPDGEAHTS